MEIETALRAALSDIAQDAPPSAGMAAAALRRARRRQHVARTAMAGTAAAVAIPVGMTALVDPGPDRAVDGAASGTTSAPSAPTDDVVPAPSAATDDIVPAPAAHELDDAALAAAFDTCISGFDGAGGEGADGWDPVFGVRIDSGGASTGATTWVVARRGDDFRADCALNDDGELLAGGFEALYGAKSTPSMLYALVDGQEGEGIGRYVEPVATITVQSPDGPEQAAVARGGFWFLPMDRGFLDPPDDTDAIGVPPGFVYRGYSADGELLYDSTTDGPSIHDCYADPTGTEFVGNYADRSDPSECVRTHRWEPIDLP